MRLHGWLLLLLLVPSIASARSRVRPHHAYSIGAAVEGGDLVIALFNPDPIHAIEVPVRVVADTIQYDWLTVEIRNDGFTRTLPFVADRDEARVETARIQPQGLHFETIDVGAHTRTLPPGDYEAIVTWDGLVTTTNLNVPYVCGFARRASLPKQDSSKLPYLLGGLAIASLFVALGLAKRAGTAGERVPCSPA